MGFDELDDHSWKVFDEPEGWYERLRHRLPPWCCMFLGASPLHGVAFLLAHFSLAVSLVALWVVWK